MGWRWNLRNRPCLSIYKRIVLICICLVASEMTSMEDSVLKVEFYIFEYFLKLKINIQKHRNDLSYIIL